MFDRLIRAGYHALMRFLLLPFILVPSFLLAAPPDCTEADFPFTGCTNITINNTLDLRAQASTVTITITGDMIINASILLDGGNGSTISGANSNGGSAGPGASAGGGIDFLSTPESGKGGTTSDGTVGSFTACSNGGGGGGLFTAGENGKDCADAANGGTGGVVAVSVNFDFTGGSFRGGFGGGAGSITTAETGAGGGGGGALEINAANVTINSMGKISARGGNGGNSSSDGGGGGGGSGGALWVKTSGLVTNKGTIDLRGGDAGRNLTGAHGNGGKGGDGAYQFEDVNGTRSGSGLIIVESNTASSSTKLTSDISCGNITSAKKDNHSLFFQLSLGFMMGIILAALPRRKFESKA